MNVHLFYIVYSFYMCKFCDISISVSYYISFKTVNVQHKINSMTYRYDNFFTH